jgi:hypothetical protein
MISEHEFTSGIGHPRDKRMTLPDPHLNPQLLLVFELGIFHAGELLKLLMK